MTGPELRTSQLLAEISGAGQGEQVLIDEILERFRHRAFGALLLTVTLPAFLPVPVGMGAVSGPLVMLIGLQLMLLRGRPWLPRALRRRGLQRESFARFAQRLGPWLNRLERLSQPRWQALIDRSWATMLSGLLLVLIGLILALPIPLTNYPVGLLVLVFAIALIERDGAMLAFAWATVVIASLALLLLAPQLFDALGGLLG